MPQTAGCLADRSGLRQTAPKSLCASPCVGASKVLRQNILLTRKAAHFEPVPRVWIDSIDTDVVDTDLADHAPYEEASLVYVPEAERKGRRQERFQPEGQIEVRSLCFPA